MKKLKNLKNPKSFFERFLINFVMFYTACLVVVAIFYFIGKWDPFIGWVYPLAFSTLSGLLRAAITKPGELFMSSPMLGSSE